jgi:hypothetical protein
MNDFNLTSAEDLSWLDKLVDGELSDQQRRELLLQLENHPDGWRRCALSFLEAQAWKRSLGAMASVAPAKESRPQPARARSWWSGPWGSVLAAAASFMIAFGLGLAWRGHAMQTELASSDSPAAPSTTTVPGRPTPEFGFASDKPQWGTMTVNLDRNNDGSTERVELPIVGGPGIDERWLQNQPDPIPSPLRQMLERRGHQIRQQRQYVPFDLGDGRRVIVPVDEVDVRYEGNRQFQ